MSDMWMMERRGMLARAMVLIGAAVTIDAPALAKAAARETPYLDAPTFALLSAVADTIVPRTDTPGAVDARVPAKFDALLTTWASGQRRYELSQALSRIDALGREKTGKGFADLSPEQRHELLAAHDAAALTAVPDTRNLKGMAAMMAGRLVADPGYAKLRELIVLLYYYSQEALTSELVYEHNPGGWTPSVKATPETRATGGLGMF